MAEVTLKNVSKSFPGGVQAVHDLSLEIPHGKFAVLLGPSGCGKTTTLRLMAGLEEPDAGEIRIGGRLVNHIPPQRRDVAVVFQSYALYPHMTVAQNMGFGLKMRGVSKEEIQQKVLETSRMLGLENLLARYPGQLSGGQRQRVALGRAIVRNPALFLLDEPLSNLDAQLRTDTRVELLKLQRRLEGTFVYVTHDQVEAMTLADIIVVMNNGIKQQVGSPREIYAKPANTFVASFIGSPKMNLIDGIVSRNERGDSIIFNTFSIIFPESTKKINDLLGEKVTCGIRPEDILVCEEDDELTQAMMKVEVIENLGNQQFLYGTVNGSQQLRVGVDPRFTVAAEDQIGLNFPSDAMHFYDSETGIRL